MFEKRHDLNIEFAHTTAACPMNAGFVVNVHLLPVSRKSSTRLL
ncbi:hypothetical protein ECP03047993_3222 [Escherichia coli P0304799.3]|nr:hypothetical protein ECP03047993_3222 [Escherichia coli P0304799.3]